MTTSNSRPLDLWMVINCTPQSLSAPGSGRAVSLSRAALRPGPSSSGSPSSRRSRQLQRRSRLARAVASTHDAPPSRSQTCSSQVPSEAVGLAARRAGAEAIVSRTRPAATRPSSLSSGSRSAINSGKGRGRCSESSLPAMRCRSSSERPHQGARKTPSQATRSWGLSRARARTSASRTSGRAASCSSSTARKGIPASRRA